MKAMTSAGVATDTAEYDAFGVVISRTGSTNTQKGFAGNHGYQEDSESGYKLLGHRYYDAATGRFLTRAPIKSGRNWYVYCDSNPLKAIDASGLSWHNPGQVWVDPRFQGEVWILGEPGVDQEQVLTKLKPGQISNPSMDVDLVVVTKKDSTKQAYLLMGKGYSTMLGGALKGYLRGGGPFGAGKGAAEGALEPEHYWVDEDGVLRSSDPLLIIMPVDIDCGLGILEMNQQDRLKEAKRRPVPKSVKPSISPRPSWAK